MGFKVAKKDDNSDELEVFTNLIYVLQGPARQLQRTSMRFRVQRCCLTSKELANDVVSKIARGLYCQPVPVSKLTCLVKKIVEFVSLMRSHDKQLFITTVTFGEGGRYLCEIACEEIQAYDELVNLADTLFFVNPRIRAVTRSKLKEPACCSICLEDMSAKCYYAAHMPCSHVFHCNCVVKWLRKHNTCPLCRFELSNLNN